MKAAIAQLSSSLEVLVTNEPINRAEGNIEQADLEAANAAEIRQAIAVLRAADSGPIWPAPTSEKTMDCTSCGLVKHVNEFATPDECEECA